MRAPSPAAFRQEYERPRRPVVLTNALDDAPALSSWSLHHLARTSGDLPVRVRVSRVGEKQLFAGDPRSAFVFETRSLSDAVGEIAGDGDRRAYVQHGDLSAAPGLATEVGELPYVPRRLCSPPLLWACGVGTVNPLHWDCNHVLLAQIVGEKTFVIFPPEDSAKVASWVDGALWRTTALDLAAIDRSRFPDVGRASA